MPRVTRLSARRACAYYDMTPALKELVPTVQALLARLAEGDVPAALDLGRLVDRLLLDEITYGFDAVQELTTFLRCEPWRLVWARNLQQAFDEATVARLPSDGRVTLEHLGLLAAIPVAARRRFWLDRLLAEDFTPRQLLAQVEADDDIHIVRQPPRLRRPPSAKAGAEAMTLKLARLRAHLPAWQEGVVDALAARPPGPVDPILRGQLQEARKAVATLDAELPTLVQGLAGGIARIERVLAFREQQRRAQVTNAAANLLQDHGHHDHHDHPGARPA